MPSAQVCISYHQNSVKDNFNFPCTWVKKSEVILNFFFFSLINLTFGSSTKIYSSTFKIYPGFLCLSLFFLSHSLSSWFKLSSLTWIFIIVSEWVFLLLPQYNIQSHPFKKLIKSYNSSAQKRPVAYHLRVNV